MPFKLAIANRVGVKVEGKYVDDAGAAKAFSFTLVCNRLNQDELRAELADKESTAMDFFRKNAKDWREQQLVHDEDGAAAPFSPEALDVLLAVPGMAVVCWQAYLQQAVAISKN